MRKFILATAVSILLSISAGAADMRDMQHAAAKLAVYGTTCAPLSGSLSEMVGLLLQSMGEAERTQAIASATVLAKSYGGAFCDAVRPDVEQLERK
jgi:hypothetical protein